MLIRDTLFPAAVEYTATELAIIAQNFSNPTVKKYLLDQAAICFRDINMSEPNDGETPESFLRRRAAVQGGLAVLQNLLSIEPPKPAA